jgi:hypothetical protein
MARRSDSFERTYYLLTMWVLFAPIQEGDGRCWTAICMYFCAALHKELCNHMCS